MIVGGRSQIFEGNEPYYWTVAYSAEMYDLRTKKWRYIRSPMTPRVAANCVRYQRFKGREPSILIVGGQYQFGMSGYVLATMDEYDPNTGLYHCHQPLPYPVMNAAVGVWNDKLHIIGGGEWLGFAGTRTEGKGVSGHST